MTRSAPSVSMRPASMATPAASACAQGPCRVGGQPRGVGEQHDLDRLARPVQVARRDQAVAAIVARAGADQTCRAWGASASASRATARPARSISACGGCRASAACSAARDACGVVQRPAARRSAVMRAMPPRRAHAAIVAPPRRRLRACRRRSTQPRGRERRHVQRRLAAGDAFGQHPRRSAGQRPAAGAVAQVEPDAGRAAARRAPAGRRAASGARPSSAAPRG